MIMAIELIFRNKSQESSNLTIAICYRHNPGSSDDRAVAWQVIKNCAVGNFHPFKYPLDFYVGASDSDGNYMSPIHADCGDSFEVVMESSGHVLKKKPGQSSSPDTIEVMNCLDKGAISANILKSWNLFDILKNIYPQSKAAFMFKPRIWLGVVPEHVKEGDIMTGDTLQNVNTELSLLGINRANIVMSGGGDSGRDISFALENIS